jgi:type I restriction enzyme S subunit
MKCPMVALSDCCEFLDHLRRPVKESERVSGPYPYFGANGQQGWIEDYLFHEPLVLLAEDGGHFSNPERGIAYKISGKTWVNNHAHVLRPIEGVITVDYLFHALRNRDVRRHLSGSTRDKLTKAGACQIEIPLPPLEEQRRIAAMLDQCTILNASQELHLSKIRELEGGLLHQLDAEVQGESTTVALSTLTESGDKINYGVVQPGVHVDAGVPLIRVGDLAAGTVNRSALKSIDPSIESLYSRSRIRGNEILISCVGSIGLIAEVYPEDVGSNIARAVARVPVSKDVNRTWLAAYLRSRKVQRYFTNELRTVSQPTLNIKQIEETEITLPPLGRQQAFAIRLEMVQQKCAQRVRSLQTVRQLANALATQVFAGGD